MDEQSFHPSNLNDLEKRLANWQPSTAGLDVARMLFAAGRSSVQSGWSSRAWPLLSGFLAVAVAALGIGLGRERSDRLKLAAQLHDQASAIAFRNSGEANALEKLPPELPAPSSYLAARWAMDKKNIDAWADEPGVEPSTGQPSPRQPIWNVMSSSEVLEF